jgi:hypothetical protein
MVGGDSREGPRTPAEERRLAEARALGMEESLRASEEDPPLCASCQAPAPSPISDESARWTRRQFTLPGAGVSLELTLCPECSAPSAGPRVIVDPIAREALRAAGCTCDPVVTIDAGDLATGHDDGCTMLRRKWGV